MPYLSQEDIVLSDSSELLFLTSPRKHQIQSKMLFPSLPFTWFLSLHPQNQAGPGIGA